MKNLSFLLLLLWISDSLAQSYIPMVKAGNYWKVVFIPDPFSPPSSYITYTYILQGDSTIGGFTYKKLYHCESNSLHAMLREDTLGKKVFGIVLTQEFNYDYNCPLGEEELLYNFNLNMGDSIKTCISEGIMGSIDSLNIMGNPIIGYKILPINKYVYMGVGGEQGILQKLILFAEGYQYLAAYGNTNDCSNMVSSLPIINEPKKVMVYPNPVSDIIHLSDVTIGTKWQIIDIYGKLFLEGNLRYPPFDIPLLNLPTGVYFIHFSQNNEVFSDIFVKQ